MKQEIAKEYPDKEVKLEYMLVDLSSFRSVKDFTVAFREKNLPLHVLINNAATVCLSRGKRTLCVIRVLCNYKTVYCKTASWGSIARVARDSHIFSRFSLPERLHINANWYRIQKIASNTHVIV